MVVHVVTDLRRVVAFNSQSIWEWNVKELLKSDSVHICWRHWSYCKNKRCTLLHKPSSTQTTNAQCTDVVFSRMLQWYFCYVRFRVTTSAARRKFTCRENTSASFRGSIFLSCLRRTLCPFHVHCRAGRTSSERGTSGSIAQWEIPAAVHRPHTLLEARRRWSSGRRGGQRQSLSASSRRGCDVQRRRVCYRWPLPGTRRSSASKRRNPPSVS